MVVRDTGETICAFHASALSGRVGRPTARRRRRWFLSSQDSPSLGCGEAILGNARRSERAWLLRIRHDEELSVRRPPCP